MLHPCFLEDDKKVGNENYVQGNSHNYCYSFSDYLKVDFSSLEYLPGCFIFSMFRYKKHKALKFAVTSIYLNSQSHIFEFPIHNPY